MQPVEKKIPLVEPNQAVELVNQTIAKGQEQFVKDNCNEVRDRVARAVDSCAITPQGKKTADPVPSEPCKNPLSELFLKTDLDALAAYLSITELKEERKAVPPTQSKKPLQAKLEDMVRKGADDVEINRVIQQAVGYGIKLKDITDALESAYNNSREKISRK